MIKNFMKLKELATIAYEEYQKAQEVGAEIVRIGLTLETTAVFRELEDGRIFISITNDVEKEGQEVAVIEDGKLVLGV